MGYEVKVIKDSVAPCGKRLTTITARYPRFIHSEVMTHRDRARNAASSRAIPFPVMMTNVIDEPVVPLAWLTEQRGMQGGAEVPERMRGFADAIWEAAMKRALAFAEDLHRLGRAFVAQHPELAQPGDEEVMVHKSLCNRLVEPWMWITTLMTATEWKNFFRLRCHPDAEQHFQKIANAIREALDASAPTAFDGGEWHTPFVDELEFEELGLDLARRVSVARCARVSYLTHDGLRSHEADLILYDRLVKGSGFGHWSPHEHVAMALEKPYRSGPYFGWNQFRKEFEQENVEG